MPTDITTTKIYCRKLAEVTGIKQAHCTRSKHQTWLLTDTGPVAEQKKFMHGDLKDIVLARRGLTHQERQCWRNVQFHHQDVELDYDDQIVLPACGCLMHFFQGYKASMRSITCRPEAGDKFGHFLTVLIWLVRCRVHCHRVYHVNIFYARYVNQVDLTWHGSSLIVPGR